MKLWASMKPRYPCRPGSELNVKRGQPGHTRVTAQAEFQRKTRVMCHCSVHCRALLLLKASVLCVLEGPFPRGTPRAEEAAMEPARSSMEPWPYVELAMNGAATVVCTVVSVCA